MWLIQYSVILDRRRLPVSKIFLNCVKQESMYCVISPARGPQVKDVDLDRVGTFGHFLS